MVDTFSYIRQMNPRKMVIANVMEISPCSIYFIQLLWLVLETHHIMKYMSFSCKAGTRVLTSVFDKGQQVPVMLTSNIKVRWLGYY